MQDNSCLQRGLMDLEEPDFMTREKRKARKQHKCSECRCSIFPGETYEYIFGIWGGYPQQYKNCEICIWTRKALNLHPEDDAFGLLWNSVKEAGYNVERNMVMAKLLKQQMSWAVLERKMGVSHVTLRRWVVEVENMESKQKCDLL